ncbi:hypothetical protein GWK47_033923 [Chionoecetes opilio]|uniref:Uncharacterized protein n=1 Tax=Chionoecetes opilio TaxID=41210 RepID=A0A8J4YRN2_CHIOP|nr:hypothetical protein GWK47_033923 [Chionoecetes opilio]
MPTWKVTGGLQNPETPFQTVTVNARNFPVPSAFTGSFNKKSNLDSGTRHVGTLPQKKQDNGEHFPQSKSPSAAHTAPVYQAGKFGEPGHCEQNPQPKGFGWTQRVQQKTWRLCAPTPWHPRPERMTSGCKRPCARGRTMLCKKARWKCHNFAVPTGIRGSSPPGVDLRVILVPSSHLTEARLFSLESDSSQSSVLLRGNNVMLCGITISL